MRDSVDPPAPDKPRERAALDALHDLASALHAEDATDSEIDAALNAVRQVPIDLDRMLNSIYVPEDAGEYEDLLRSLLLRIPDGWGRWIGHGPGWYPILARLDEKLRSLDPDYEIHQIKEKYGTLRVYWTGKNYDIGEQAVEEAEAESARTCELCGEPGRIVERHSWLRTLCPACSTSGSHIR